MERTQFMWHGLRNLLLWLLCFALGNAPVPWSHSHDALTAEQLARHLQDYHPHCPASDLPVDWHFHCDFLGLPGSGHFEEFADDETGRCTQREQVAVERSTVPFRFTRQIPAVRVDRHTAEEPALGVISRSCLFKQYGAFLV